MIQRCLSCGDVRFVARTHRCWGCENGYGGTRLVSWVEQLDDALRKFVSECLRSCFHRFQWWRRRCGGVWERWDVDGRGTFVWFNFEHPPGMRAGFGTPIVEDYRRRALDVPLPEVAPSMRLDIIVLPHEHEPSEVVPAVTRPPPDIALLIGAAIAHHMLRNK